MISLHILYYSFLIFYLIKSNQNIMNVVILYYKNELQPIRVEFEFFLETRQICIKYKQIY